MTQTTAAKAIRPAELFAIRPFRLLWANSFLFILVQSTQRFAFVALALDLGAASDINGLILFVMGIPALLISLPVGVMSDHWDRRKLLMTSQGGALGVTVFIAVMVTTGAMNVGWLLLAAVSSGTFIALGAPVRTAVLPTLVPGDKLVGAIAVSSVATNIALILGPATAWPVIAVWGLEGAFWLQVALYVVGLAVLVPLRLPPSANAGAERKSMRVELMGGISFIRGHEAVRSFVALLAASTVFMMAPWIVLGPQIAEQNAGASESQAFALVGLLGIGQFITSMMIMRFNHKLVRKGLWFMCGLCWGSGVQIALGQSNSIAMMGVFLFMWGLGGGLYMNLNQTLIQNNTPPQVMGRVMAIHSLLMTGLAPLGALAIGVVARTMDSAPLTFSGAGVAMLASALWFLTRHRHLRALH
ncbi:MAG: MFS transporter [Ilumatobacteraceae bacterium]